jgi:hypothetical protein
MARWLQWIVLGAAVAVAVLWIGAATVTAPAMELPPLIPAHRATVDAVALAKADPLAFVEPPPLAVLAGAATASAIAPRARAGPATRGARSSTRDGVHVRLGRP